MLIPLLLAAVAGYLLGSLPFGWLIARKFGINIFEHGSKNPGATNVKRVLGGLFGKKGKRAGDLAFTLDALKGAAAAGWPLWLMGAGTVVGTTASDGSEGVVHAGDQRTAAIAAITSVRTAFRTEFTSVKVGAAIAAFASARVNFDLIDKHGCRVSRGWAREQGFASPSSRLL